MRQAKQIVRIDHLNIMAEPAQSPIVVRAVLSGSYSVGKTSLLRREVDCEFTQGVPTSIGIDFKLKMYQIGDTAVKGQLWDSIYGGGEKCFGGVHNHVNFYRNSQAVGFCFAIDNKKSFEDLHQLIASVRSNTEARLFLIGCKGDLMPEVPDEEVMDYAEKHKLAYFRTSSLQNWGVNEVILEMMKQGLPLRQAQLQKQKEQIMDLAPLKPPCKQKCEIM